MTTEEIPAKAKEVRLAARPDGALTLAAFEVVEVEVPEPAEGEVVVRTDYLQLTAVMQDLMKPEPNLPMPGYQVGETLWGGGVGTVVASNSPDLAVGDTVQNMGGFRAYTVGPAGEHWKLDPTAFPSPLHHLTQGVTAYHGIVDIAEVKDGDTVFVSGAAGGVGSLAGQIAKLQGAKRVIGAAGSKAKVEYLVNTLGYDAAFDYHDGPVVDRLRELAPDGIDVFFDTVGGEQFEAAVQAAAPNARFALCGALAGQVGESIGAFPRLDVMTSIVKQISIRPFSTYHTPEQIWAWNSAFAAWTAEGRFVLPQTLVEGGHDAAPQALIDLLGGKFTGNVVVKI
ncbi:MULTISPECIES: MDR family NADP-dependent oxidoreductase [Streptomyces]|uniref:NADPH-dependent curcumin reductase CurA n=1 Tax=Streptomyces clavifer TaxID=68188 RepID=A0ABS4VAB6_9ACTN|nr:MULTISPECIES: NADP-dependent oxidoreductase [Streptomyces]KQX90789.1 NADP-dependent oxidoreductase [Streptomyces sp. Root1319]KQZ03483.1 NADP-dependent oxidoreductase [Streptomyces sp. Root55]MBP2360782.1 NADPH-dependent curcumin reductase CurA [Streptomyces clavifer]MDX2746044.1 NADP-dependent oxidoreductase [Streptomyces sp. NRRL_B-2557]MDX3063120.1 NADP-dependent oxidoreductase [Streptomyces sp. ND04-05B]